MHKFAITLLLISAPALACPNLAGNYAACRSLTGHTVGQTDMIVKQTVQNRITTYEVSAIDNETRERISETYKADGKLVTETITDPETGMTLQTSSRTSCTSKELNVKYEVKLEREIVGKASITVSKQGNQLLIESKSFDGEEEVVENEICE